MADGGAGFSLNDTGSDDFAPEESQDALALAFTAAHHTHLRYVAGWGKWLEYDGARWAPDPTLQVFDRIRRLCRDVSKMTNKPASGKKIASSDTVAAVERLARSDRRHAALVEQWDADPWLLNTPGGTVDLRTGKMRPHDPADHITKQTTVTPGGNCPMWKAFLATVTCHDAKLEEYLQRLLGYALTGSIREHALAFFYGTGANGKGVLLNTVSAILADYAVVAPIETFIVSHGDQHPTGLAMLRGARLVTSQETEEGRRWAESRIKAMTGGDPISARFMRADFFTFTPVFKLIIAGNHKPGLRNVDEAIRRRFNLVPFDASIPMAERDKDLPEKLKAEWPGILAWMIAGCLEWQRDGLAPPAAVVDATEAYLAAEDRAGGWLEDCCVVEVQAEDSSSALFGSWKSWAEGRNEHVGSQKAFSERLEKVPGVFKKRTMAGAMFVGIRLTVDGK